MNKETFIKAIEKVASSYPEIDTKIDTANTTNSIYVTMQYNNLKSSFRISDHRCPKYRSMANLIVCDSTKLPTVMRFVQNCFKNIKTKSLYALLSQI